MSKLEELIARLCPDGVEYKPIKETYKRLKGTPITAAKMKEIQNPKGNIRIFAGGKTIIDAMEDDIPNANITRVPAVLVQSRGIIDAVYYDKPFTFKNEMWAYTSDTVIETKFLYYILKNNIHTFRDAASGMGSLPQISLKVTEEFKVPVPPLEVQREIVHILDSYTASNKELKEQLDKELAARQKQYEFYRDALLTFKNIDDTILNERTNELELSGVVRWMALHEICDYVDYRGKTPKKVDKGVFLVTAKNVRYGYIDYEKSQEYISSADYDEVMRRGKPAIGDILITTEAPCGNVALVDREDIALAQRIIKYRPKNNIVLSGFLKHYLLGKEFQDMLTKNATGGTVKGIKGSKLHLLKIPVPPLSEQQRIVDILDRFDALCNDITSGLPAEIEARKKQYEYYRDKLLTFKELKKEA